MDDTGADQQPLEETLQSPSPAPTGDQPLEKRDRRPGRRFGKGIRGERDSTAPTAPATAPTPPPPSNKDLLRMIDADLDAEIEAAMAGFDVSKTLDPSTVNQAPASAKSHDQGPESADDARSPKTYRVLAVRGDDVFVDAGGRTEGLVSASQFDGKSPQAGDLVELVLDHEDPETEMLIFRRPGAAQEADWGTVAKGMIVDAVVRKVNKGGLEVTVNGLRGFLPAGQVDVYHVPDLSTLLNQSLRCEVTEANLQARNLIVSRRVVLEREREEKARATFASLAENQVRDGIVRRIADYGAFVDIGGVDGLLHVSQLSWQRVKHPSDVLAVGQPIKVMVLEFDPDSKKISLGLRQLEQSPWDGAALKYHPGTVVTGRVTKLMEFGAFVELEPGVEGLAHISELSRHRVHRPGDVLSVGQEVDVKVISFDRETQRISLSVKQAIPPEPEVEAPTKAESSKAESREVVEDARESAKVPRKSAALLKGGLGDSKGPLFG